MARPKGRRKVSPEAAKARAKRAAVPAATEPARTGGWGGRLRAWAAAKAAAPSPSEVDRGTQDVEGDDGDLEPGASVGAAALDIRQRRWLAAGLGTFVSTIGYWAMLLAVFGAAVEENAPTGSTVLALSLAGLMSVPITFLVIAGVSRQRRPWQMAAIASVIWTVVVGAFVAVGIASGTGLPVPVIAALAYGSGAVLTLRPSRPDLTRARLIAVGLVSVWVLVFILALGIIGVFLASVFPINAVALADTWVERRRPAPDE